MAIAGAVFLSYELWRLLFQSRPMGAVDLKWYSDWVHDWFAGKDIYTGRLGAEYPPATFVLLWPLVGWLGFEPARWVWAAACLVALAVLAWIAVRESGARTRLERTAAALIPCSMYASGAAIGNGQLTLLVICSAIAAILILARQPADWRHDLAAAALFIVALSKPSLSPPFFWVVLFAPGRIRPAALVVAGYAVVTMAAASVQHRNPVSLFQAELPYTRNLMNMFLTLPTTGERVRLRTVLTSHGVPDAALLAAVLIGVALLGVWVYRYRRADVWLLMSGAAFFARLWAHHNWYDDFLLFVPAIALFRIVTGDDDDRRRGARILLVLLVAATIAPGGAYLLPQPWTLVYQIAQIVIWAAVLVFLLAEATGSCASSPPQRACRSARLS